MMVLTDVHVKLAKTSSLPRQTCPECIVYGPLRLCGHETTDAGAAPRSDSDKCPNCDGANCEDNGRARTAVDYTLLCLDCHHQWSPNEEGAS